MKIKKVERQRRKNLGIDQLEVTIEDTDENGKKIERKVGFDGYEEYMEKDEKGQPFFINKLKKEKEKEKTEFQRTNSNKKPKGEYNQKIKGYDDLDL